MKKLVLLALLLTVGFSKNLNDLLVETGKPFGLADTLRAIVIIESDGGKYRVNLQDPSCGITMIHIKYFLKRHNKKDTPFNRNLACQQLISNDKLAIAEAIDVLEYWKSRHCTSGKCTSEQWMRVWASYNGGNNWNGKKAQEYAKKVKKYVDAIKIADRKRAKKVANS